MAQAMWLTFWTSFIRWNKLLFCDTLVEMNSVFWAKYQKNQCSLMFKFMRVFYGCRFIAVTQPIKYAKHKNSKRVFVMLAMTWIISLTITSPIALGINYTERLRAASSSSSSDDDDDDDNNDDDVLCRAEDTYLFSSSFWHWQHTSHRLYKVFLERCALAPR